jgi:hypothetical protein
MAEYTMNTPKIASVTMDDEFASFIDRQIDGLSWFLTPTETRGPTINDKPCPTTWCRAPVFTYSLVSRNDPRFFTPVYTDLRWTARFKPVFDQWIADQGMTAAHIFRAGINCSLHQPYDHCEPHMDQSFPHYVWLWYLDTVDAPTILFDQDLNITHRIPCVKNTAVCFDGSQLHAQSYPPPCTPRRVLVVNFGDKII